MIFDLEHSIKGWLTEHNKTGSFNDGQLVEIEDHLRSKIHSLMQEGLDEESAFDKATEYWGKVDTVASDEAYVHANQKLAFPMVAHLRFILRLLKKSPISSILNVSGLAVGIAAFLVILLFISKEYSFDEIHEKKDRIFRVELSSKSPTGVTQFVTTGPPTGEALMESYEEVENYVTIKKENELLVRYEDNAFYEDRMYYVGDSFFEIFDFQLEEGSPKLALSEPGSVVLTKETAIKYFGESSPMGKTIEAGGQLLNVTGVLGKMPNTHFDMSLLVSFANYEYPSFGSPQSWAWVTFYNYILLKENASWEDLEKRLPEMVEAHFPPERHKSITLSLKGIKDIYLTPSPKLSDEVGPNSNRAYSRTLGLVGVLILVIAGLNYVNLSTAIASRRAKEIGIKKALGVNRKSLIFQLLWESIIISIISALLAFALSFFAVMQLGSIMNLALDDFSHFLIEIVVAGFSLAIVLGVLSGIYPAFFLGNLQAKKALLPTAHATLFGRGTNLRKVLVAFQYAVSITLVVVTLVMLRQVGFLTSKHLGFDQDNILVIPLNESDQRDRYETFETILEQDQRVKGVAAARLGLEGLHGSYQFVEPGTPVGDAPRFSIYPVNNDFVDLLNIEHLAGRKFSEVSRRDTLHQFMINRTALEQMGWTYDDVIGKHGMLTGQGGIHGVIIGVVNDFHFEPLQNEIEPLLLWYRDNAAHYVYIKVSGDGFSETLAFVQDSFEELYPEYIFEYEFLNARVNENYKGDQAFSSTLLIFSSLAILISCVGLFGLTIFSIQQKIKEVSIRKVLGANITEILLLLNREFLALLLLTSVFAIPLGYYLGSNWLNNFAYRTDLSPDLGLKSFLMILLITAFTVSYHTLKAAFSNPAKIIRHE